MSIESIGSEIRKWSRIATALTLLLLSQKSNDYKQTTTITDASGGDMPTLVASPRDNNQIVPQTPGSQPVVARIGNVAKPEDFLPDNDGTSLRTEGGPEPEFPEYITDEYLVGVYDSVRQQGDSEFTSMSYYVMDSLPGDVERMQIFPRLDDSGAFTASVVKMKMSDNSKREELLGTLNTSSDLEDRVISQFVEADLISRYNSFRSEYAWKNIIEKYKSTLSTEYQAYSVPDDVQEIINSEKQRRFSGESTDIYDELEKFFGRKYGYKVDGATVYPKLYDFYKSYNMDPVELCRYLAVRARQEVALSLLSQNIARSF